MASSHDEAAPGIDEIETALEHLKLHSEDVTEVFPVVTILADASRQDLSTRKRLASPEILSALVEIVESSINDSLETTDLALRCIGNASIDNNDARDSLTNIGFSWAHRCLQSIGTGDLKTPLLAIKVLYNICCDHEPAQQKCLSEHIHYELIHLCSNDLLLGGEEGSLLIELLFWICSQKEPDSSTTDPLPEDTLSELVSLPQHYHYQMEIDDFAMLLEICLRFLRDGQIQRAVILGKQARRVMDMLQLNEAIMGEAAENEDNKRLLVPLSNSLIWCLSDMAAIPEFSQSYSLDTDWMKSEVLETIKHTDPNNLPRLLIAACQILANLLWAMKIPEAFAFLAEPDGLAAPTWEMIGLSPDPELIHAAAGLLIQLARPPQAREALGDDSNARAALELLCKHETPQLKQDGIKLLRALGRECRHNQERFADLASEIVQSSFAQDANPTEAPA